LLWTFEQTHDLCFIYLLCFSSIQATANIKKESVTLQQIHMLTGKFKDLKHALLKLKVILKLSEVSFAR